jgi:hypothetical protein
MTHEVCFPAAQAALWLYFTAQSALRQDHSLIHGMFSTQRDPVQYLVHVKYVEYKLKLPNRRHVC